MVCWRHWVSADYVALLKSLSHVTDSMHLISELAGQKHVKSQKQKGWHAVSLVWKNFYLKGGWGGTSPITQLCSYSSAKHFSFIQLHCLGLLFGHSPQAAPINHGTLKGKSGYSVGGGAPFMQSCSVAHGSSAYLPHCAAHRACATSNFPWPSG